MGKKDCPLTDQQTSRRIHQLLFLTPKTAGPPIPGFCPSTTPSILPYFMSIDLKERKRRKKKKEKKTNFWFRKNNNNSNNNIGDDCINAKSAPSPCRCWCCCGCNPYFVFMRHGLIRQDAHVFFSLLSFSFCLLWWFRVLRMDLDCLWNIHRFPAPWAGSILSAFRTHPLADDCLLVITDRSIVLTHWMLS